MALGDLDDVHHGEQRRRWGADIRLFRRWALRALVVAGRRPSPWATKRTGADGAIISDYAPRARGRTK